MAKSAKLKVYRTPIGFHDAYVAASSQKAALEAWGTDTNLFARGAAEIVTDPTLTEAPLAQPGVVVKRLRGTAAEQIAALPPDALKRKERPSQREPDDKSASHGRTKSEPKPKPSRQRLDRAEAALNKARTAHETAGKEVAERRAALEKEEQAIGRRQRAEREQLERKRDEARAAYEQAIRDWQRE